MGGGEGGREGNGMRWGARGLGITACAAALQVEDFGEGGGEGFAARCWWLMLRGPVSLF
jgi:hypothetical protein